jgi:hypothetical protein
MAFMSSYSPVYVVPRIAPIGVSVLLWDVCWVKYKFQWCSHQRGPRIPWGPSRSVQLCSTRIAPRRRSIGMLSAHSQYVGFLMYTSSQDHRIRTSQQTCTAEFMIMLGLS